MLRELSVQNLALIEDIHVELEDGLLCVDGRDRGGQEFAADGAGTGAGRQGIGRLDPLGEVRGPRGRRLRDHRTGPARLKSRRSSAVRSTTSSL